MLSNSYAKNRLLEIDKRLANLKAIFKNLPQGRLHCANSRGRTQYYQIIGQEGHADYSKKYLGKKSNEVPILLAKKELYKAEYLDLLAERKTLQTLVSVQEDCMKNSAFSKLRKRKLLLELISANTTADDVAREWANAPYSSSAPNPEKRTVPTIIGIKVRSKSEAEIIFLLVKYGIPFRYECDLISNGVVIGCPDFTIMHPVTHEIFIWEHFGMLDDLSYVRRNIGKVQKYIEAGYRPMINFLMTSETLEKPFDVNVADALIRQFLLQ